MISAQLFIWLDVNLSEVMAYYDSVFEGLIDSFVTKSEVGLIEGANLHLPGVDVMFFNGGPFHKPNEATSIFLSLDNQAQIDLLWERLAAGGPGGRCGWVTDPYGVTWQLVPSNLGAMLSDPDPARATRVRDAMLQMGKLDIAVLEAAHRGDA